jgi:hypothetical protein
LASPGIKAVKQGMTKAEGVSLMEGFFSFEHMAEANPNFAGESAAAIRECLPLAKDDAWSRHVAQKGLEKIDQIMKPKFEALEQAFATGEYDDLAEKVNADTLPEMAKADPEKLLAIAEQGILNGKDDDLSLQVAFKAVRNAVRAKPELALRGIKAVKQGMTKAKGDGFNEGFSSFAAMAEANPKVVGEAAAAIRESLPLVQNIFDIRAAQKGLEKIGQIMKSEDKIQVAKTNRKMAQLEQGLYTGDFSHMDFADLENLSDVAKANPDKLFDSAKKALVEAKNTGTMVVASDALASVVAVQPKRAKEALDLLSQSLSSGKYCVLEVMHVASDCVDIANANPDVAKQAKEVKDKFDVAYVESKKRLKSNRSPEMIKKISEAKTQRH